MNIAIYDSTGKILETRRSSAGTVPNLPPGSAWRVVPDECHPDTHMTDPMGLTCTERPSLPITMTEQGGELVIAGLPAGTEVLFHGHRGRHGGTVRLPMQDGQNHHLFIDCWPYRPVRTFIDKRVPKAEREAARRVRIGLALSRIPDPETRAALRAILDI